MPVAVPSARPDAVSRSLWGPVTVRVAWELVLAGLQARPDLLAEAREHVLRSLPPGVGEHEAEELASGFVAEWLERRRDGRYRRPSIDPDLAWPLTLSWRHRLHEALDPLGEAVLRLHYGDGFPMDAVARSVAVDVSRLEMARGGIREAVRTIAIEEGVPLRGWPIARLDALVARIARLPEPGCPGPGGLLTEEGRSHADTCPRCSRTVRLVRSGILSPNDLFPPEAPRGHAGGIRPEGRIRVLALLLHPDGRKHLPLVERVLGDLVLPVGTGAWLLAESDLAELDARLRALALEATPARHHLRGSLVSGSGRWIGRRLIGPVAHEALETARSRPWGEVEGVPDLPAPLPPPPKATRWWLAAAALVALTVAVGAWVMREPVAHARYPVQAEFQVQADGWRVGFDVDELAVLDIVARQEGRLQVVHRGVRREKGRWADGNGAYLLQVPGQEVMVIASAAGVPALDVQVQQARSTEDPMAELARLVLRAEPQAAISRTPAHGP